MRVSTENIKSGGADISQSLQTIAFKYPNNGHLCIALSPISLRRYICGWNGVVSDCHILFNSAMGSVPLPSSVEETFAMIFENDENGRVEIQNRSTTNEEEYSFGEAAP